MKRMAFVLILLTAIISGLLVQKNQSLSISSEVKVSPTSATKIQRQAYEQELITLINSERTKRGLKALQIDLELMQLTRTKSEDMRDNDYFSTTSPRYGSLTDMLKSYDYRYRVALEKILGGHATPQAAFDSWMKNSNFAANILKDNLTHLGVGFADGKGEYFYYWTLWLVEKPVPVDNATKSAYVSEVLRLINIERASRGLQTLEWHTKLADVAKAKSEDMRDKNYFAHQSPTYGNLSQMLKHFGISFSLAAENIAAGQKTPKDVVTSWMNSEGHRKNILEPAVTHLGVGYADGRGDYYTYWTQLFLNRK